MEFLQTRGRDIVTESGRKVYLRGTNIGAWMNMEDFMDGFPGVEHRLRYYAKEILGKELGEYLFTSLLDHFFTEKDVAYMASIGVNVLRFPINYRHFEDDMNPFVYKEEGFLMMDKVMDWCEKYGIYVIIDLHAAQGHQNCDWHSDNNMRTALLWRTKHFRDRVIALWEKLAERYKDRAVVAAYDLLNEPTTNNQYNRMPLPYVSDWDAMNSLYHDLYNAIRAIDPKHIIAIEGDDFSRRFVGLDAPYGPNMIYSSHNYSFVLRRHPEVEKGSEEYYRLLNEEFYDSEWWDYVNKYNVPLWVSEFSLGDGQLDIFKKEGIHWTSWSLKMVGSFGLLHCKPDSKYMQFIRPVQELKSSYFHRSENAAAVKVEDGVKNLQDAVQELFEPILPGFDWFQHIEYFPKTISDIYVDPLLQHVYLNLYQGLTKEDIDELMDSFSFDNCEINRQVEEIHKKYCDGRLD